MGIPRTPTAEQAVRIRDAKRVIFDRFQRAQESGIGTGRPGILVDEEFGADGRAR